MLNDFKNDDTNISSEKLLEGKIEKRREDGVVKTCTYFPTEYICIYILELGPLWLFMSFWC